MSRSKGDGRNNISKEKDRLATNLNTNKRSTETDKPPYSILDQTRDVCTIYLFLTQQPLSPVALLLCSFTKSAIVVRLAARNRAGAVDGHARMRPAGSHRSDIGNSVVVRLAKPEDASIRQSMAAAEVVDISYGRFNVSSIRRWQ